MSSRIIKYSRKPHWIKTEKPIEQFKQLTVLTEDVMSDITSGWFDVIISSYLLYSALCVC